MNNRGIYIDRGILHTGADDMSIYGVENRCLQTENIHRYTLRTDGFVSIRAGYGGGEFTTKPFVYSGNSMFINYSTSAVGSIRVELQDLKGTPLKGFQIEDCIELFGGAIDEQVVWNSRINLGSIAGKQTRLRFLFNDADIYAFNND